MKLYVHGPIPCPSDWLIAPDGAAPPGYMRLCSLSIARREPANIPGPALVPREDIDALPSQIARLLCAFERCDQAGRAEVLLIAERLAAVAP
jgi:hypothetical protein